MAIEAVLREAFRVLKPGGRFAVSDVVVRGETPPEVQALLLRALETGEIQTVGGAPHRVRVPAAVPARLDHPHPRVRHDQRPVLAHRPRPDRHADIGRGKSRSVINSISNHGNYFLLLFFYLGDYLFFFLW